MNALRSGFLIVFGLLLLSADGRPESNQPTVYEALETDYRLGKLTEAQYTAYQLLAIRRSEALPEAYRAAEQPIVRLGTGLAMRARQLLTTSQGEDRRLLQQALSRPIQLPFSQISASKKFCLHYALEGPDAVADAFLIKAAEAFDRAYYLIVEELGYPEPPPDLVDGPEYDVYIHNIGDYGFSTPEDPSGSTIFPYGYTSFIQIDNDFINTYTKGIDGMKVTAAHEFFHMVQLGMRTFTSTRLDTRWFYEACASWMEDVAYDEINDYLQYLPHYLSHLDEALYTFNGIHEYGTALFLHMLEKKYERSIVRNLWEEFAGEELYDAIDQVLQRRNSSLAYELMDHLVWNYFTSSRADVERYYPEGYYYPELKPDLTQDLQQTLSFSDETQLLSGRYVRITVQNFGDLSVQPQFASPHRWRYTVISKAVNLPVEIYGGVGNEASMIADLSASSEIMVITANVGIPVNDMRVKESYQYQLTFGKTSALQAEVRKISPNPFMPDRHDEKMRIDVRLVERVREFSWFILDENGRSVYRADVRLDSQKCGDFSLWWDGRNNDDEPLPPGVYMVFVQADQEVRPQKFVLLR
ncbi:MAG: DUF6055 domain-containing protein [candidate division KSB1 bacterium]|nr:DUF6055 domain-containing protein [candidate division KSB1 bacterium]